MYGGKPPKPITSTGDSAPSDKTKTNNSGFRAKKNTRKQNEAIKKNSIHIAKKISKLQGKIETSTAKKPHGTYVSIKKQRQIIELTKALEKLKLQSAEIHKDGVLRGTQPPEPGKSTKALESPQTQSNNKTRQSEFQRGIENGISQKQFKSQEMYQSKQRYITSRKQSLSTESQKLLYNKVKLEAEIAAAKEAEKTKPQGEPKKPSFFNKISSLFKMKKKTKQNKLNNIKAKLTKLNNTQSSVAKYEEEQNKAYTAKQYNYARRLDILKTIPTATAKSNVPTTQTESTKLQQTTPKNKKQATKKLAETEKIVEEEKQKLGEATKKVDEIRGKLTNTKPDYAIALTKLSEIELTLKNDKKTEKDLKTELETLSETIKSKPNIDTTSPEFIKYDELKDKITRIESKNILTQKEMRIAQEKVNEEVNKQIDLEKELEAAKTIKFDAEQTVQAAEETLNKADKNLIEVSKTRKQRQADEKQRQEDKKKEEAEADKQKKNKETENNFKALQNKINKAVKNENNKKTAEKAEDAKKANEAFKKTLPGLQTKREDIAKNLEELKSKKIEAEGAFNVAKQNKNDADEIVRSQREELNDIRTKNKNNFKTEYAIKFPGASLTGEIYLKAQEKYINEIETYNPVVRNKILDLEISKKEANKYKEKFEKKSNNKNYYLVQIKKTKKELAILDTQITNFKQNTPTNTSKNGYKFSNIKLENEAT